MTLTALTPVYTNAANTYAIKPLGMDDIADAMELIAIIKSSGCLAKPHHLKERTFEQFAAIVKNGFALLGARNDKGQLIAFVSVAPTLEETQSMTIRALSVHPDHAGNGWGKELIRAAVQWTQQNGDDELLARVSTDNTPSLKSFSKTDFYPVDLAWDSDDGYWYYILSHKKFLPPEFKSTGHAPAPTLAG